MILAKRGGVLGADANCPSFGLRRFAAVLVLYLAACAAAAGTFQISDIRVEGLQRIAAGTVFNLLPVKIGDTTTDEMTATIIRTLYGSGFFEDVQVKRDGSVLVISVRERPAIAEIIITGNKDIEEDSLRAALKDIGLAEGRVFNKSLLARIEQELRNQYFARGKYGARIQSTVSPLERNRVRVTIHIQEGLTARIKQINIIGNRAFSEETLLAQFKLSKTNWHSFYSKNDRYSKQQLAGDLEALRSFYLDRGYIQFAIQSTQVSISADKKDIYITIGIKEGKVFTVSDIQLAGDPSVPVEKLFPLIHMRRGEPFSRKAATQSAERISKLLSEQGYAFANVNVIPELDEENQTVKIVFFVDPGKRVYVRRTEMKGNTRTRDEVLRREMRQLEAAWFSSELVKKSRERLQRLGYFEEVSIETPAVPGSADQVDVKVRVKEKQSGSLAAGIGYSQSQGMIFNTSITQKNFLGTGKRVSFGFDNSSASRLYRLAYTNPYYTIDGISRGFEFSYRSTDYDQIDSADYTTDVGIAGFTFGLPITDTSRAGLGFRYQYTKFTPGASLLAQDFALQNGDAFDDFILSASYTRDSRDSAIFPTEGSLQRLLAEIAIPGSDLQYYRITYRHRQYIPLTRRFTFLFRADLGYGGGFGDTEAMPFFEHFFAGGPRTVRGWKENTLGPRETTIDRRAVGGNVKLAGSLELFMPPPIGGDFEKSLRLGLFFDFGNIWLTSDYRGLVEPEGFSLGDLRYSTGVSVVWLSPVGALSMSLAYPINQKDQDETQVFQFGFGSTF